jgi:Tol biopolymer transport system component
MTTPQRFEQDLPALVADTYLAGIPDYRDDLLELVARTPQRPAWRFPGRWLPMDLTTERISSPRVPWRALAIIAVIAMLAAAALYAGTHQTRLPAPFGPAANGVISFERDGDIYIGDPATRATHLVVGGPEHDWGPSFSQVGTQIGFLRDTVSSYANALDLYVVRQDGSDLRRLNPEPILDLQYAHWTPDGRIAVIHLESSEGVAGCAATTCQVNQLDVYRADGSGTVERIAGAAGADELQFRPPDGREILYRAFVDGREALFTMNADGTGNKLLVASIWGGQSGDLDLGGFVWSADGQQVFYQRADPALAPDNCCRLWVINADGTNPHEFRPPGARAWDGQAVPSPDGTRVAYWHGLNDDPTHPLGHGITIVRADGTGAAIEAGPTLTGTAHWIWSPDSSKILLYPNDGSSTSAYLVDPSGGPSTLVPWTSSSDLDWQRVAP